MSRGKTHDNQDAVLITRRLHEFLDDYAPNFITSSDHTLKAYEDALALYFEFLQVKGVTPDTLCRSHLERSWIEDWMVWLRVERGNSPQTVNNRLSSMRKFLDYLARKEVSLAYIYAEAKAIERLKVPKRHVEGMSKEAVKALLAAPDTATPIGRRDTRAVKVAVRLAERAPAARGRRPVHRRRGPAVGAVVAEYALEPGHLGGEVRYSRVPLRQRGPDEQQRGGGVDGLGGHELREEPQHLFPGRRARHRNRLSARL